MADHDPTRSTNISITVPPEHLEGHYADFASVWHNNETFILDFVSMTQPPKPSTDDPQSSTVAAQVVTRVRIPAGQVWEVMKALENQLGRWEAEHPERSTK